MTDLSKTRLATILSEGAAGSRRVALGRLGLLESLYCVRRHCRS